MSRRHWLWGVGALVAAARLAALEMPAVSTEDVDRFYRVFDSAQGHPTADALQREYLEPGSTALHQFARLKGATAASIVKAIDAAPEVFADARHCAALLPAVKVRVLSALQRLSELYPPATFPPLTFLIGRNATGGTTDRAGVLIGLETLCWVPWLQADREDRFVQLIAHEYAHVQQPLAEATDAADAPNLLVAEIEGGAELVAELTSGAAAYESLQRWARGRERSIEQEFVEAQWSTDRSAWFYNGRGTPQRPGDLGYWVGYRITKAYYRHADDKRAALREILNVRDPRALLDKSGWYPGIVLD